MNFPDNRGKQGKLFRMTQSERVLLFEFEFIRKRIDKNSAFLLTFQIMSSYDVGKKQEFVLSVIFNVTSNLPVLVMSLFFNVFVYPDAILKDIFLKIQT